ncbi:MAG: hypothetical protein AAF415_20645, partial [Pseudomonadota bacterium]
QFPDAFTCSMKSNNLIPEIRRVRVPCSWHVNIFPLQPKSVHKTGGTPVFAAFGTHSDAAAEAKQDLLEQLGETPWDRAVTEILT